MIQWVRQNPRAAGGIVLGALIALAAAFSAGRFSAPLKVETRDVIKTQTQIQYVDRIVTQTVQAKAETRIVYRDVERKPDGTVIDHTVTKSGEDTTTTTKATDNKAEDVKASTEQTHTQTVTLRPQWAVALQVGAALPKPWLQLYGPLVIGAEVDYRLVGGLSVGVWINTFGAAGGALKLEF